MKKVNYVIATWSGSRREPNNNYLKNHLIKLLSLKNNLSQITIVKPTFDGYEKSYYDVEKIIDKFDCDVVILEKNNNLGQSYGQLFFTYEEFGDLFDYYIFVEDDYIPNIDNFDSLLLEEYISKDFEGYLCSYAGVNKEYPNGGCSVSNGIISTNYIKRIYEKFPNVIQKIDSVEGWMCHVNFANVILHSGLSFKDFASDYRVPYFGNYEIIEYGRTDTSDSIFVPHQLFEIRFKFREMIDDDLPKFLSIRNESKEFLHNNSEFSIEETKQWFHTTQPKFFIIELGQVMVGYFRTSNWEKDSLYIGCDIDSSLRGFGLGYLSYLKFMEFLKVKYEIKKFKLEVLSTNIRALNLYKKLGFKDIGVSENKIFRGDVEVESIIMEL